jgi:hypothetical protein
VFGDLNLATTRISHQCGLEVAEQRLTTLCEVWQQLIDAASGGQCFEAGKPTLRLSEAIYLDIA